MDVVRGAGGVVRRRGDDGQDEILLIHRRKHRDWTFPKGKTEPDESDEECAVREVEEETHLRCELDRELRSITYTDDRGRHKSVRYWLMRPVSGSAGPGDGVDEVEWVTPDAAAAQLSYDRDRDVLASFTEQQRA